MSRALPFKRRYTPSLMGTESMKNTNDIFSSPFTKRGIPPEQQKREERCRSNVSSIEVLRNDLKCRQRATSSSFS
jgi:hypothetical protein